MIRVYRLVHERSPERDRPFRPGPGAHRWNSDGVRIAYASEHIAVSALEILAQWEEYPRLDGYRMYALDLEPDAVEDLGDRHPDLDVDDVERTRAVGDAWAGAARSLALRIPSVPVPFGANYLVNPEHPRFDPARIVDLGDFRFDPRIGAMIDAAKAAEGRSLA